MSGRFFYRDPNSVPLPLKDRLYNKFHKAVASIKGKDEYPQIGLRPDGVIGRYTVVKSDCVLHN